MARYAHLDPTTIRAAVELLTARPNSSAGANEHQEWTPPARDERETGAAKGGKRSILKLVRLAGVEPATLGLEVLAPEPHVVLVSCGVNGDASIDLSARCRGKLRAGAAGE